ncbi:RND transporter [Hyphomicrobium methylovorum]|uniref:efflux RND transporter permease subunit n=1 Tax=Hyphomicrobium methylovorum TaxID=84 RepID=UPI0015E65782|nr:MMPL family transporter [Hyphomicrobium methylovorum]MBA2124869.1 RND transporter [Hyphomicrobium methylovorum]
MSPRWDITRQKAELWTSHEVEDWEGRLTPADQKRAFPFSLGLNKLGLIGLKSPVLTAILALIVTAIAAFGLLNLRVDDSLSELFRTNTPEFKTYEEIDKRFPSSEYDVLVVVEGKNLLTHEGLTAFAAAAADLQLADGVAGIVSMLSARGHPDPTGYAPPVVPDDLPEGKAFDEMIAALKANDIVKGKFLSEDGQLAMIVLALDRAVVEEKSAKSVIGEIEEVARQDLNPAGLSVKLAGAPVMQLEIRNAVERDQIVYNGFGLLFGAVIAAIFFRRVSLMLVAALPPVIAVVWSLGLLGWLHFKLNLFLNVMTPLIMVMGFADSMQMVSAIRIRLREGDNKLEAVRFAINVVGPACVLAHGAALLSFLALLFSESGLIRAFGEAGAMAVCISFIAVIVVLPILALLFIRNEDQLARDVTPADGMMDSLGNFVGGIVDRVVKHAGLYTLAFVGLFSLFAYLHLQLEPRYRLADQVPDREQALAATGRIDSKLTGANPFHVMIQWKNGASLYDPATLQVIKETHEALEKAAGLGNVWSLESLRRWLREMGGDNVETIKKYVNLLPKHLVRRFIDEKEDAVLVTGRLPDVDASQILPVVKSVDHALDPIRQAHPEYEISVTGLPALAARNSYRMISQLDESIPLCVLVAGLLLAVAFRSPFVGVISLLPGLFPVVASGALLWLLGGGLEFASVVALLVTFGLGVDALIHFLNRLRLEEGPGVTPEDAIRHARVLVGPAIILTTIVLAFGLGVTIFSELPSLRLFGFVCSVTLIASLFADLVFLPATILVYRRYISKHF